MNRRLGVVEILVIAVPTSIVFSLVRARLDDQLMWIVAVAIAIVPGVLAGLVAQYLYKRMVKKP